MFQQMEETDVTHHSTVVADVHRPDPPSIKTVAHKRLGMTGNYIKTVVRKPDPPSIKTVVRRRLEMEEIAIEAEPNSGDLVRLLSQVSIDEASFAGFTIGECNRIYQEKKVRTEQRFQELKETVRLPDFEFNHENSIRCLPCGEKLQQKSTDSYLTCFNHKFKCKKNKKPGACPICLKQARCRFLTHFKNGCKATVNLVLEVLKVDHDCYRRINNSTIRHKCDLCGLNFGQKGDIRCHMTLIHAG